jgi:hypothetical protein
MINKDNLQEDILGFILFARFLMLSKITFLWRIVYLVHHTRRVVLTASLPTSPGKAVHCDHIYGCELRVPAMPTVFVVYNMFLMFKH